MYPETHQARSRRLLLCLANSPSPSSRNKASSFSWVNNHPPPCQSMVIPTPWLLLTVWRQGLRFSSESQSCFCWAIRKRESLSFHWNAGWQDSLEWPVSDFHRSGGKRIKPTPEESCTKRARYSNTFVWVLGPVVPEVRTTPDFHHEDKYLFGLKCLSEYSFYLQPRQSWFSYKGKHTCVCPLLQTTTTLIILLTPDVRVIFLSHTKHSVTPAECPVI